MVMTSVNQAVIETLSRQIVGAYLAAAGQADTASRTRLIEEVAHALAAPVGRRALAEEGPDEVNAALADWEAREGRPFGLRLIEIDQAQATVTMA
ncbi:hypothetical protein M446_5918 [Methylobacterium sp. 4-46]|uniref:hypothetical protein n=1 Tax=unclassified Methylobacterium TaxID=2615210 RepID=UPI000165CAF5|nr:MULTISPECIES: hypothetical protein [Methylobacterium]ACA20199.1 hypothetical protein M446_5918 [Methylobacterium sp. 4-46]WFT79379.1 hypothetical protein QA634_29885 [Methylobacterium nodulans]